MPLYGYRLTWLTWRGTIQQLTRPGSLLKRSLGGTYVRVRPFHLFRYLDEQAYRYNKREWDTLGRVTGALGKAEGRRVTWKQLTGKEPKQEPPKPLFPKPRAFPMGPF